MLAKGQAPELAVLAPLALPADGFRVSGLGCLGCLGGLGGFGCLGGLGGFRAGGLGFKVGAWGCPVYEAWVPKSGTYNPPSFLKAREEPLSLLTWLNARFALS